MKDLLIVILHKFTYLQDYQTFWKLSIGSLRQSLEKKKTK